MPARDRLPWLLILPAVAILVAMNRRFTNLLPRQVVRNDAAGLGHFGAPRGGRTHQGLDLRVMPGDPVYSPITGRFVRVAFPYANDRRYTGAVLNGEGHEVKVFYIAPLSILRPGDPVRRGQLIGHAQDVAAKYSGPMMPHIHVEVRRTVGAALLNPANHLALTTA